MAPSIRITITPQVERVIKDLQEDRFALLEPAEIIRVILSEYDALRRKRLSHSCPVWMDDIQRQEFAAWEAALPVKELPAEHWKRLDSARQEKSVPLSRAALWKKVSSHRSP